MSPLPIHAIDPSRIIVSLESTTATHRTTLSTLTSRPSHLATWLSSLLPQHTLTYAKDSHTTTRTNTDADTDADVDADADTDTDTDTDSTSIISRDSTASSPAPNNTDSAFHTIFQQHLTSAGLIPPSTFTFHVFLDRPSAP
jgi:hypothetical protein